MASLDRIDKNGTKYYHTNVCYACGGTGTRPEYMHVENGRCFVCGGSGSKYHAWKEYTPEYAAKLAERRLAKARAHADERNREFCKSIGFSEEGFAWFVIGNCYAIKDQLKEDGARWSPVMGWHFNHEVEKYPCFKVDIRDISEQNESDLSIYLKPMMDLEPYFEAKQNEYAPKSQSEWIGEVGEKLSVEVKLLSIKTYETHITYYGETHYIFKFVTVEGNNTVIWNTTSFPMIQVDGRNELGIKVEDYCTITGKVKEHSEYRGDKQTILTRCKLTNVH